MCGETEVDTTILRAYRVIFKRFPIEMAHYTQMLTYYGAGCRCHVKL